MPAYGRDISDSVKVYWINIVEAAKQQLPIACFGYGVTAHDEADAINLLQGHFRDQKLELDAKTAVASIGVINDLSEIEQNHVRPNMGNHMRRGVWFPLGLNYDRRGW